MSVQLSQIWSSKQGANILLLLVQEYKCILYIIRAPLNVTSHRLTTSQELVQPAESQSPHPVHPVKSPISSVARLSSSHLGLAAQERDQSLCLNARKEQKTRYSCREHSIP